jgi:hypothetical protein
MSIRGSWIPDNRGFGRPWALACGTTSICQPPECVLDVLLFVFPLAR